MYQYWLYMMLLTIGMANAGSVTSCGRKAADVIFVVDTSASIWEPDFSGYVLPFIRDVVNMFDIGPSQTQTRVGMVTFGDNYYHQFHLNKYQTKEDLDVAISDIPHRRGNTYTHLALEYVTTEMFTKKNGARDDVAHVVVVLTDGESDIPKKTKDAVEAAKKQGIQIFAIGVGFRAVYRELRMMASDPKEKFMFLVYNFKALENIKDKLAIKTCLVTVQPVSARTTKYIPTSTTSESTTTPKAVTAESTTSTTKSTTTPNAVPTESTTPTTKSTTTPTAVPTESTTSTTKSTTTPTAIPTESTTSATKFTTTPTAVPTESTISTTKSTPTPAVTSTEATTTTTEYTITTNTQTPTTTTVPEVTAYGIKATPKPLDLPQGDQAIPETKPKKCDSVPADVYFILDVSSSLWEYHFDNNVLPFVRDLVRTFDIAPTKTRVGVVTFADNVNPVFGLDKYTSSDELLKAVNPTNIKYTGERKTNTASAISYVRQKGFASHVAREDVAQIVIVITDGRSVEPSLTAEEAQAAKDAGINMFAIGVGPSVDAAEMKAIATEPDDRFVFRVNTYDALSGVKDILAAETCNLRTSGPRSFCKIDDTDLIFVFESASKAPPSRRILKSVITDFAEKLKVQANQVRVGSLTDPCPGEEELSFLSLESFRKKVDNIVGHKESKMHRLMRKLRLEYFGSNETENADHRKVGVIFLDDKTVAPSRVVSQAKMLRKRGVELYVVSVGDVSEYMVAGVAADESHVIRLTSYRHLQSVKLDKLWNICA